MLFYFIYVRNILLTYVHIHYKLHLSDVTSNLCPIAMLGSVFYKRWFINKGEHTFKKFRSHFNILGTRRQVRNFHTEDSQPVSTTVKNVVIIIIMTGCSGFVHPCSYILCSYIYTQCPYQCSYNYSASFVIVIKPKVKIMHCHIIPGFVVHHFSILNELALLSLSLH